MKTVSILSPLCKNCQRGNENSQGSGQLLSHQERSEQNQTCLLWHQVKIVSTGVYFSPYCPAQTSRPFPSTAQLPQVSKEVKIKIHLFPPSYILASVKGLPGSQFPKPSRIFHCSVVTKESSLSCC